MVFNLVLDPLGPPGSSGALTSLSLSLSVLEMHQNGASIDRKTQWGGKDCEEKSDVGQRGTYLSIPSFSPPAQSKSRSNQ